MKKYSNKILEEQLFPVFLEKGTVKGVYDYCKANEIVISQPTLGNMRDYWGWERRKEDAVRQQVVDKSKTGVLLFDLLIEVTEVKNSVRKELKVSPGNVRLLRVYGTYLAQLLAVIKDISLAQKNKEAAEAVDKVVKAGGLTEEAANEIKNQILFGTASNG